MLNVKVNRTNYYIFCIVMLFFGFLGIIREAFFAGAICFVLIGLLLVLADLEYKFGQDKITIRYMFYSKSIYYNQITRIKRIWAGSDSPFLIALEVRTIKNTKWKTLSTNRKCEVAIYKILSKKCNLLSKNGFDHEKFKNNQV